MKVKELIKLLSKIDEDYEVRKWGTGWQGEGTAYDTFEVEIIRVGKDEAYNSDKGLIEGQEIIVL